MSTPTFLRIAAPTEITAELKGRVVAATGHRPKELPGGYSAAAAEQLTRFATRWLEALSPRLIISGLAQGWDQAVAEAASNLDLPWHAAIPCDDQESKWPIAAQRKYRQLRAQATSERIVTPGRYQAFSNEKRNRYMVEIAARESGLLLALWSGAPGGTCNCLNYSTNYTLDRLNTWDDFQGYVAGQA